MTRAPAPRSMPRTRPVRQVVRLFAGLTLAALLVSVAIVAATSGPAAAERIRPHPVGTGSSATPSTTPVTGGTATVTGAGYGHGVGMSQYGAFGMARSGASAEQILAHYYAGVGVQQTADATDVKVNVVHRGRSVVLAPVAVSAQSGQATPSMQLNTLEGQTSTLDAGDQVRLTPTGSGVAVQITRASGSTGTGPTSLTTAGLGVLWTGTRALAGPDTLASMRSDISGTLTAKVRSYRWGRLWVTNLSGLLEVVVTVDLHSEYLRGVAEMPSSWPTEALQAQVAVARTYALRATTGSRSGCGGCQLWDDQRSQVYTGWAKESERIGSVDYGARWVSAVQATEASSGTGLAVLYGGQPIDAVYFSSSGGHTRNSVDVWGGSVPYLVGGADDHWSLDRTLNPGYAAWSRPVTVASLRSLFGLPDLISVTVTAKDAAGAATQVSAVSGAGKRVTVSGATFQSRLGLPSAWVGGVDLPTP